MARDLLSSKASLRRSAAEAFVGPPFSYHRVQDDSVGLNYYVRGHNAKIQMEYSYLHGNTFADKSFSANRVWTQIQIMF
jgi:hypothetical protein